MTKTLISPEYLALNAELHKRKAKYGGKGHDWLARVVQYVTAAKAKTYLDYGCGKGTLADAMQENFALTFLPNKEAIFRYDPVTAPDEPPACDFVTCCDVLEHIEPKYLDNVLEDLAAKIKVQGLLVISQRLANKTLADGRNAHLIVKPTPWWMERLGKYFDVVEVDPIKPKRVGIELAVLVTPKQAEALAA